MKPDLFVILTPSVANNESLREPQRLAYRSIQDHDFDGPMAREVGIVLPVGCGKSGLLALAPFALKSRRTLLVAPNLNIADQLVKDLTPSNPKHFYSKRNVLTAAPFPEPAEIRGAKTNVSDLDDADIVVTNIQQLQRENNKWLDGLSSDFFDLILFDEAHHNVAASWETIRTKFPQARIINVSATPARADGQKMSGEIIYSYPISEAMRKGFVKRISGHRLSPQTLKFVRRDGGAEVEVGLDEVRKLGETDAEFRRSIVSSEETLTTIVDASIRKLHERRQLTSENRLKIIASALNMEHCKQIVAKYRERGLRADFVHSKQDGPANTKVYEKLDNHQLDVIVQVRKLGEGFDHPFLSIAAIFSIFANLSPFVQFVGRIMRVIPDVDPFSNVNEGVVVFHVGSNITGVWNDFTDFAEADQEYFAQLVDEGNVEPLPTDNDTSRPRLSDEDPLIITSQSDVRLENIHLLKQDPEVLEALRVLTEKGVKSGAQYDELNRITPTKQASRQAKRTLLDDSIKTEVGRLLASHNLLYEGRTLDATKRRTNFETLKSAIDKAVNAAGATPKKKRPDLTSTELDTLLSSLPVIVATVEKELL